MNCTKERSISLLETFDNAWIKLPMSAMRDCGVACQTLGGLLAVTNRETFSSHKEIARSARLPVSTVRKHLAQLHAQGWVNYKGRQRTRAGYLRRTATISVTRQTKNSLNEYGVLPWWACCKLPWCGRALLAFLVADLMKIKSGLESCDDDDDLDRIEGMLIDMEYWRFSHSLTKLQRLTGLSRHSIIKAKQSLRVAGFFLWEASGGLPDILLPNMEFRAVITEKPNGRCLIELESESRQ